MDLRNQSADERTGEALHFRESIGRMSARGAQAVSLRLVSGQSRAGCAAFFAISQSSFDVMLLRAARELRAIEEPEAAKARTISYAQEVEEAKRLAECLEHLQTVSGEIGELSLFLHRVQSAAAEIRAQDAAAILAEKESPLLRRRHLLWRALLLAIVGVSLLLYLRPRVPWRVLSRSPQEQLR